MRSRSGQAMVELALVLPAMLALVFGAVEAARLADARSGLDAATAAAASAAARAPAPASAQAAAQGAFAASVAAYPLEATRLELSLGGFERGGTVVARGSARVRLDVAPVPGLPPSASLTTTSTARIQSWRSR